MTAVIVLAVLTVVCALACAVAHSAKKYSLKFALKTVASLLFVTTAVVALTVGGNVQYGAAVIGALVLGLLGDVFLSMDPFVKDDKTKGFFYVLGGAAFAVGHVFYIVIFFTSAPFNPWLLLALPVLPLLAAFLTLVRVRTVCLTDEDGAVVSQKKPLVDVGKLAFAFVAYAVVLGLMLVSALNVFLYSGRETFGILLLVAACCFVVSDVALMFNDFVKTAPKRKWLIFVVMLFYYAAQAIFAVSAAL